MLPVSSRQPLEKPRDTWPLPARCDGAVGGHDQQLSAPYLPTHTTQMDSPGPLMAGVSGASTPTPQKMVDAFVNQDTSNANEGMGETGSLDLSNGDKKDAPCCEAIGEEDLLGKN